MFEFIDLWLCIFKIVDGVCVYLFGDEVILNLICLLVCKCVFVDWIELNNCLVVWKENFWMI